MSSAICFNLDKSKILLSGNGLIKFYLNSQRMSDSFYHITESCELNKKKGPKHTHLAMFWNFCVG